MKNTTKIGRFVNGFAGVPENRKGQCTPDRCETLDGKKGAACCHLDYACPLLSGTGCSIYPLRPHNCRVFPMSEDDLKLVRNCGYYFE